VSDAGRLLLCLHRGSVGLSATLPTLTTDQFDYHPGDTITISGSGWESGEGISMVLSVDPSTHADVLLTAVADEDGNFTNTDYVRSAE
jgi:hypothetical protein